jgi:hypothetical protein
MPTIILSEDGFNAVHDAKQGPIITHLLHDEYNNIYLLNILFWISRLKLEDNYIFLNNRIKIYAIPLITNINVGIRFDRLNTEFKDRVDELYAVEEI